MFLKLLHLQCSGSSLDEIAKDIQKKFHITQDEYYDNEIDDIVETHMCNMCDWYDHMLFGEGSDDPFGMRNDIMSRWDKFDFNNLPNETDDGIKI